jgi:hypothetical protein
MQLGPELGPLYTDKTVDWSNYQRTSLTRSASGSDLQSMNSNNADLQQLLTEAANHARNVSRVDLSSLAEAINGRTTPPLGQNGEGKKDA